jgi:transcriptional regulator with XRE-family HTH domain
MGRSRPTHVDDPVELGRRIRGLRTALHLSLRDVAFPGCSASFLSRVEAGNRVPSVAILAVLAGRLGTTTEALLGRSADGRMSEADLVAADATSRTGDPESEHRLRRLLQEARSLEDRRAESRVLASLARLLIVDGRDSEAVEMLEAALVLDVRADPRERPELYVDLGRLYAARGDHARATRVLQAAFESAAEDPADVSLLARAGVALAATLSRQDRMGEAEETLRRIAAEPTFSDELADRDSALTRAYVESENAALAERYARRLLARIELVEERRALDELDAALADLDLDRGIARETIPPRPLQPGQAPSSRG